MKRYFPISRLLLGIVALGMALYPTPNNAAVSTTFTVSVGGRGGAACTGDPDSGLGASLGLTCQPQYSDDFNTSTCNSTKWSCSGTPSFGSGYAAITRGLGLAEPPVDPGFPHEQFYLETRMRVLNFDGQTNLGIWMCGGPFGHPACPWTQDSVTNMPEIDIMETAFTGTGKQCIDAWYWTGSTAYNATSHCGDLGVVVTNGSWIRLGVYLDPNPAPNGTLRYYQEQNGVMVDLVDVPNAGTLVFPYNASPSYGPRVWIGAFCPGGRTCTSGEMDVDYVHMYY